jgi:uncharacterized protein (TIGR03437 family)
VAPGILAPTADINPAFTVGGKQYAVATLNGVVVGIPSLQPVKPNDSIWLYGIGLGDTKPAIAPGVIATGQEMVNAQIAVQFGNTARTVVQSALYPTFVGLYYIIVTVPNVPDGDYQINITVDGQALQQQPFFLTVHH